MRRSSRNLGFTLMELVLVLVILAICAAVAAPNLRGFNSNRLLPNTATALVTTLRWCRVKALSDGVEYRLNFDTSAGKWWVTMDEDGTGTTFADVTDDLGREYTMPEGITFESIEFQGEQEDTPEDNDGSFISFRPGGRCDVATIALTSVLTTEVRTIEITCDMPLGSYYIVDEGQQ